jgi:hypothetical protein
MRNVMYGKRTTSNTSIVQLLGRREEHRGMAGRVGHGMTGSGMGVEEVQCLTVHPVMARYGS